MKKFLLTVGILAIALPAFSSVDVKETTTPEYLDNYGYSDEAVRVIQMQKAMFNGEKYIVPVSSQSHAKYYTNNKVWNSLVDATRSFFTYLDPALDKGQFLRTDIKYYSNTSDY